MSIERQTPKRTYRKITPRTVAEHQAQAILSGNGTQAVRDIEPEYTAPRQRAVRIVAKSNTVTAGEYIENSLQQIGGEAIERIGELVHSEDERIATKNAHFVVEHIRGKAVQRNLNANVKLNIQSVLD
ncbi:hypothetical protein KDA23_07955 [Candidatus Saccharibacteria bacterium]|nr:hypothetical protein [Candidatus Saccharibacteria bacterium]